MDCRHGNEDEIHFCFPFPSASNADISRGYSGDDLAPSIPRVYVLNLNSSLANSDLHALFSTFGEVARVTVVKDRASRRSKGITFVLFISRLDTQNATRTMDGEAHNSRALTASIAANNGRASEFIKQRVYTDKSNWYECGDNGHLLYECPRSQEAANAQQEGEEGRPTVAVTAGGGGERGGGESA